jgi:hypothetical protein
LVLALAMALASRAHAEPSAADRETARALMDEADRKLEGHDLEGALKDYRAAHAIMGVPTTGIEVARTHALLGRLLEALDAALAVVRIPAAPGEPTAFARARADAATLASDIEARIPSLRVDVIGPDASAAIRLVIDGDAIPPEAAPLPRRLDPGHHVVAVSAPGYRNATREIDLAEHDHASIEVALARDAPAPLAPAAAEPPPAGTPVPDTSRRAYAWGALGVGGAGLAIGVVTGALSLARASDAHSQCTGDVCTPAAQPDVDASKTLAWVSDAGFAVGVAGAAIGAYLLLTSPPSRPPVAAVRPAFLVEPLVGTAPGAALSGRF